MAVCRVTEWYEKPLIRLPDLGKEQALRVGTTGRTQEEETTRGKKESPSIGRGSQTGTTGRGAAVTRKGRRSPNKAVRELISKREVELYMREKKKLKR